MFLIGARTLLEALAPSGGFAAAPRLSIFALASLEAVSKGQNYRQNDDKAAAKGHREHNRLNGLEIAGVAIVDDLAIVIAVLSSNLLVPVVVVIIVRIA